MGNCYGEDSDSEDEYYGYYGKNNRLKPQPSPIPQEPNHHIEEQESKSEVDEGDEPEGLEYEDDEDEGYEHGEFDEEEEEILAPGHHGNKDGDEVSTGTLETAELGELERRTKEEGYEPQEVEHDNGETHIHGEPQHEHGELEGDKCEAYEHNGLETGNDKVQKLVGTTSGG